MLYGLLEGTRMDLLSADEQIEMVTTNTRRGV